MDQNKKSPDLPFDYSAEKAVLGCLILDNKSFDEVSDLSLDPEDFYHPQHSLVFTAIKELFLESKPFDTITLGAKLADKGSLEKIGGEAGLIKLCEEIGSSAHIYHYGKIVKEKAVLREVVRTTKKISETGMNFVGDVEEFLSDVESNIFKLTNKAKSTKTIITLKESLYENIKELEKPSRNKGEISGLSTGFKSIDAKLLGLQPGQFIIIAARPGVGKTSLVLNWAVNSSKQSGLPVAIFSYEMRCSELSMRILSSESNVDSRRIRLKDFQDQDLRNMASAVQTLSGLPIYINDAGSTTVIDIRSQCRKIKSEQGLGLIVIDYLQLMQPHIRKPVREQEIAEISRSLKQLSNELECPIIALSQLNRSAEGRSDKRPQLQDLRESGSLEQDADIVCLIHREDMHDQNTTKRGIAELIVAKNRAGEVGPVQLAWIGSQTKFAELEGNRND
jgi:replicative DNA helicase